LCQVCCDESYVCGYHYYKYLIPKTCKKEYCTYDKVPKYNKVCTTKYGYKKVCKDKYDGGYGKTKGGYRMGDTSAGTSSSAAAVEDTVRSGYDAGSGYDTGYDKKKQYCSYEKYSYPHCDTTTEYDHVKKCKHVDYDCSYYGYKKVPKYCKKSYCGPYKYGSAAGYEH
jgi:hypothetical protein